jgi:hypothetical protein
LRRFVNFYMKILPGDRTGICAHCFLTSASFVTSRRLASST